ncbi:hypothetical protein [Pectobacterium carotovorum]|uniref:hypothetical protein n=1 Tax=Pectobacterium carotovorum TaxID=554 RepID=UPI003873B79F
MKKIAVILISSLLAGCAADISKDIGLNNISGISYKNNGHAEYVKSYTKTFNNPTNSIEKLKICTLRNVTNRDVRLGDSSKSFVGSYTGNYYNVKSSSNVSGGDVLSLSGGNSLVVNGATSYLFDAGIISVKRFVRFTLDVFNKDNSVEYTFSNIQHAQSDTGSLPNDGFNDIGVWKMAGPTEAIRTLDGIALSINECLNK